MNKTSRVLICPKISWTHRLLLLYNDEYYLNVVSEITFAKFFR